ncbi:MFS transporter [Pseudarthrobacter sp. L19]|uniref:MFS transporter n=1 Tax=Pseudarthrobacter sp. L19 TaxID=3423951 RepID=UPI003D78FB19
MSSSGQPAQAAPATAARRENRFGPMGFVLSFGVVSMLADVVYEGARAITGPYLATLGASAVMVGFITGVGEAVALVLRLGTGPLADRTRKYWPLTITGYALTAVAVPLLALAGSLWQASALVITERFGKAVRTPARDTMLSHAGATLGRGRAFAIHEALDQSGALVGPLLVSLMIAVSGYQLGFGVLAIPGALAIAAVVLLRRFVPAPERFDAGLAGDGEAANAAARVIVPAAPAVPHAAAGPVLVVQRLHRRVHVRVLHLRRGLLPPGGGEGAGAGADPRDLRRVDGRGGPRGAGLGRAV